MSRILRTLAVLAIVCAQVFGVQRGYTCDHGEAVVATEAEHCHRVVAGCEDEAVPCQESSTKSCEDQGEKEHHEPVRVDLQASPASLASLVAPSYVAIQVADFSVYDWIVPQVLTVSHLTTPPFDTVGDSPPSAAVQVARCMVILV